MSFRVVVAEDNDQLREMIQMILETMDIGHNVVIDYARNGLEAYKLLRESCYDLLVTDLNMPKIDGESLLEIRRDPNFKSHLMKVLILAGDPKAVQHLYSDSVFTLPKPFDPERFIKLLKIILFEK